MKISVCGMGKLGLPMAAVYAKRGFKVTGIDLNEATVDALNKGEIPIQETGLSGVLSEGYKNLTFTTEYRNVRKSDVIFIIVPTPSNERGEFIDTYVMGAVTAIAYELKHYKDANPLVVITSTVMPGTCDGVVIPTLKSMIDRDIGVCYNPEFVALGSVIKNMKSADALLIGESDKESGDRLVEFQNCFFGNDIPPISRMNLISAELAKISLNAYITAKISMANTFAMMCNNIKGCNVDDITNFLGLDKRIGHKYLKGGLGFGGPCFPRDSLAFSIVAKNAGIMAPLQEGTDLINDDVNSLITDDILKILGDYSRVKISVLGLSYKPDTPVVEQSMSLDLAYGLSQFAEVKVHDPMGMENTKKMYPNLIYCDTVADCLQGSSMCILATPWKKYLDMKPADFGGMKKKVVYDCWRLWGKMRGIEYHAFGVGE